MYSIKYEKSSLTVYIKERTANKSYSCERISLTFSENKINEINDKTSIFKVYIYSSFSKK